MSWGVNVFRPEDRKHARAEETNSLPGSKNVTSRVASYASRSRMSDNTAVTDPLDAGSDELHVDVAAVCLPDALLRRPRRVVLHEGEQVVAVEIVAAGRDRQQVSGAQVLERAGKP